MLSLGILTAFLFLSLGFSVWSLGFAGKLLRVPKVGFARRLAAVLVMTTAGIGMSVFDAARPASTTGQAWFRLFLFLILMVAVYVTVLKISMRVSLGWAFLIMLLWLVFGFVFAIPTVIGMKRFALEAFVLPTNAMGPTLAGPHIHGTCPHCGKTAMTPGFLDERTGTFSLAPHWQFDPKPPALVECICFSCLRIGQTAPSAGPLETRDRFLVNKLLKPRRWDLLVFRFPKQDPEEPPRIYVMRLVGLPGEEVAIMQGAIWIDRKRLDLPEHMGGLQFLSKTAMWRRDDNQSLDERVKEDVGDEGVRLSEKGYFVLGDFTTRSSDSREWGEVPEESIIGVGSVIYWPPDRWRILR